MRVRPLHAMLCASLLAACGESAPTTVPPAATHQPRDEAELFGDRLAVSAGKGQYTIGAIVADFSYGAIRLGKNSTIATGTFRHSLVLGGQAVDIEGRVTCVGLDEANRRAWIGGKITKNRSVAPSFLTPIHEVGDDVWFRVVDYGHGSNQAQPDRLTFLGFEGGAGIITSAEYCAAKPWPDNDDRTNPVIAGGLTAF